jgi:hypothetical protein
LPRKAYGGRKKVKVEADLWGNIGLADVQSYLSLKNFFPSKPRNIKRDTEVFDEKIKNVVELLKRRKPEKIVDGFNLETDSDGLWKRLFGES